MSAGGASALTLGAAIAVIATWAPVVRVLGAAAMGMCRRRPQALWPLLALAALGILTVSAAVTAWVFAMLGTEMIGGPDRPTICDFDEFGCRPITDSSGPATQQAVHALHVLTAMAVVGLAADAVLLVSRRWRAPTLTNGAGDVLAAEGGTTDTAPDPDNGSATPLPDHHDRSPSHD